MLIKDQDIIPNTNRFYPVGTMGHFMSQFNSVYNFHGDPQDLGELMSKSFQQYLVDQIGKLDCRDTSAAAMSTIVVDKGTIHCLFWAEDAS